MSDYNFLKREKETVTIASGQKESTAIDLLARQLVGIRFPNAFTGASASFKVAHTSTDTFLPFYDDGGNLNTITVTVSAHVGILPSDFAGCQWVKLVSASNEAAERTVELIFAI